MILVDTSIWIDHLRAGDPGLSQLLQDGDVLIHPWVTGELALGGLSNRQEVLGLLGGLPSSRLAIDREVMTLIESRRLFGTGIGYVDAHLLASTLLTSGASLWTRDRHLDAAAVRLDVRADVPTAP